jgi:hypothetical protein
MRNHEDYFAGRRITHSMNAIVFGALAFLAISCGVSAD